MTPQAYLYICDGDIDHPVLTHKKMDWPEKYPHWQEIPLVMAQVATNDTSQERVDEMPKQRQDRNEVLEEVAKEFDKMPFGDTAASFARFVRDMKNAKT